jgi:hypothetical protein
LGRFVFEAEGGTALAMTFPCKVRKDDAPALNLPSSVKNGRCYANRQLYGECYIRNRNDPRGK